MSDLVHLIEWGGIGSFIILLALIWAIERVITAFINRNKPAPQECCHDEEDDEEDEEPEEGEEEVVAMGGQVDEHSDEDEGPPTTRSPR